MKHYLVTWEIDVEDVDTPEQAAQSAFSTVQEIGTTSNVFKVQEYINGKLCEPIIIDLNELGDENEKE